MFEKFVNDVATWPMKIIISALAAISLKLAVQAKLKKVTFWEVVGAYTTGAAATYIFYDYVIASFSDTYQPMVIAVVAISGEKIGYYIIYKINFNALLDLLVKIFKK